MLSIEYESVVVRLETKQINTPSAANDDMECIRCWYREACRLVVSINQTYSNRTRLRRRHEAGRRFDNLALAAPLPSAHSIRTTVRS